MEQDARRAPFRPLVPSRGFARWRGSLLAAAVLGAILGAAGWYAVSLLRTDGTFDSTRFSIARWEATTFLNKWLYIAGEPLRDNPSPDEAMERYFALNRQISALEAATTPDATKLSALREERRSLENNVEATIEGRIANVLELEGLRSALPALPLRVLWPPVDFEATGAPRVLAVSRRDRIQLLSSDLLNPDLLPEEAYALESGRDSADRISVVLDTSGVATYPSVVDQDSDYPREVEIAAHEWVHQYLTFHTLGRHYFSDLRDVNETVATIAGRDIAALVLARYPAPSGGISPAPAAPPIDLRAELTTLRRDVDALLAAGKVAEAEALMEQRRQELGAAGIRIRKINQAYFAFRGLYATSGAAAGDLGPRIEALRAQEGSVGAFLRAVRDVGSRRDLEGVLPPAVTP